MISALSRLSSEIAATVKRHIDTEATAFGDFPKLRAAEQYLSVKMEKSERTTVPPLTKRLKAIAALRQLKVLTRYDWQLIFAGLADSDPDAAFPVLLEDDSLYNRVEQEIQQRIDRKKLKRREWKFLCSSYFGYHAKKPDENNNWCSLRDQLRIGYGVIKGQVRREKRWMAVIDEYQDLFTADAGNLLANKMSSGELVDFSALETVAQVPDDSWLWYRAFVVLLAKILELDDDAFKERLPNLLELARQRERYKNIILRACLMQYYRSSFRNTSHPQLKQMALESWGSPQLRSKQNLWLTHLKDPDTSEKICGMVRSWLAKEDLTHFFQLLKGKGDVDQARLFYWLRFANQMGFTRIVMGQDAWEDRSSDFVAFRDKNKGRLSQLIGGRSWDNAMIMQIGDYFFVEFSGTGNAMFIYSIADKDFKPESEYLHINNMLKKKTGIVARMLHSSPVRRLDLRYIEGWMAKFDDKLKELGIRYLPDDTPVTELVPESGVVKNINSDTEREKEIQGLISTIECTVNDKREIGGALYIILPASNPVFEAKLLRLGFTPQRGNSLMFWSK